MNSLWMSRMVALAIGVASMLGLFLALPSSYALAPEGPALSLPMSPPSPSGVRDGFYSHDDSLFESRQERNSSSSIPGSISVSAVVLPIHILELDEDRSVKRITFNTNDPMSSLYTARIGEVSVPITEDIWMDAIKLARTGSRDDNSITVRQQAS